MIWSTNPCKTVFFVCVFFNWNWLIQFQAYEEAKKRLQLESEDRKKLLPELRKRARQEYLSKRREDKVQDLEQEINDELYYFGDEE